MVVGLGNQGLGGQTARQTFSSVMWDYQRQSCEALGLRLKAYSANPHGLTTLPVSRPVCA